MSEPQPKKSKSEVTPITMDELQRQLSELKNALDTTSKVAEKKFERMNDRINSIDKGLYEKIKIASLTEKTKEKIIEHLKGLNSVTHDGIKEWKVTNSKSLFRAIAFIESLGWVRTNHYWRQKFLFDVNKDWGFPLGKNKIAVDIWNRTTQRKKKKGTDYDSNFIDMLKRVGGFNEGDAKRMCIFFVNEFTKWGEPDKLNRNGYRHH
jgi:hypothetical protein